MHYCEIIPDPANKSHYVVVDGLVVSRHTDVKIAEQVRAELMREWAARAAAAPDPGGFADSQGS